MKVFNLTDRQHPDGRPCRPKPVMIAGRMIKPGESVDFPPSFNASTVAGLCQRGVISLLDLPRWYTAAKVPVKRPAFVDPPKENTLGIESVMSVNAIDIEAEHRPRKKKTKK